MARETFEDLIHARFNQSVEEVLHSLARKGYTRKEAAKYLECSDACITVHTNKYKIPFKTLKPYEVKNKKEPEPIDQLQAQINHALSQKWV